MHIRQFKVSDFPIIASVTADSFFDDKLFDYICPYRHEYPDHFRARFLLELKIKYYSGHVIYVLVTDEEDADWSGEEAIMGFAAWVKEAAESEEELNSIGLTKRIEGVWNALELRLLKITKTYSEYVAPDLSADPIAVELYNKVWTVPPAVLNGPHWHLSYLCVSPKFQRRGVGSKLLDHGKRFAAEDNLGIFMCASPAGQPMYKKNGFRLVERVELPDGWDVDDYIMAWEPTQSS